MKTGPASYKAGTVIIEEGARDQSMFVIESGSVEIFRTDGGAVRTIRTLGAGDFFGEMFLLEDEPRSASARAATDCTVLALDASALDALLRAHPEVAIRMLRAMAGRLREAGAERRARAAKKGSRSGEAPAAPAPEAPGALVTSVGAEVPLPAKAEITLGRPDAVSGFQPDIDLGPHDTQRLTSRRHAKLVREGGALFVLEEVGTANGTFVNGTRVAPGVKTKVADGDTPLRGTRRRSCGGPTEESSPCPRRRTSRSDSGETPRFPEGASGSRKTRRSSSSRTESPRRSGTESCSASSA